MLLRHNCTTASWITYCGVIVNQDIDIQAQLIQCAQWFVRNDELHAYVDGRLYIIGTDSIIELLRDGTRARWSTLLPTYSRDKYEHHICWDIPGEDKYGCVIDSKVTIIISFSNDGWYDEITKINDCVYPSYYYDHGKYWYIEYTAYERILHSSIGDLITISSYNDCGIIYDICNGLCLSYAPGHRRNTIIVSAYRATTQTVTWSCTIMHNSYSPPASLRFVADNVICVVGRDYDPITFINMVDNTIYTLL